MNHHLPQQLYVYFGLICPQDLNKAKHSVFEPTFLSVSFFFFWFLKQVRCLFFSKGELQFLNTH